MSESAQEVLHELTAAGLLSSDQATKYGADIQTGAEVLLRKLIKDGHITEYQAQKFRDGKASDIYFGDYVVIDKLGQGGMGTVLLARHRRMDRQVAIKVLPVTVLESKDAVARFYQEVKVAAHLTHPNIVLSYDASEHHGFHYLVMEYVPGHDLAEVLCQLGPIPIPMALDYIAQAAKGLDYAHRKGVVHRDIKPSNLLLNDEGVIKILDMGLARLGTTINQEVTQLTTTGQVMGTVEYMSPEQAEDTRQADERSDIYSLGCTLYRLLTGRSPFSRDTVVKTILAHRGDSIPIIETGFPEDDEVNELFRRMVAKNPEDRFQSTSMLIEALEQLDRGGSLFELAETPIVVSPPPSQHSPNSLPTNLPNLTSGLAPTDRTAIVERFDSRIEKVNLPEAIPVTNRAVAESTVSRVSTPEHRLANGDQRLQYISDDSIMMPANSEVIYIPDLLPKGRFGRVRKWLKADRSRGILLWAVIALVLSLVPVVGLVIGWRTWRAANQDIHDIKSGKRNPKSYGMTRIARFISIFATIAGIVFTIMIFTPAHPFYNG